MSQDEINQSEWNNPKNWSALTYSSRADSRIFVPKRSGLGSTINFGNRGAKIVFAGLISVPVIIALAAWLLGKR